MKVPMGCSILVFCVAHACISTVANGFLAQPSSSSIQQKPWQRRHMPLHMSSSATVNQLLDEITKSKKAENDEQTTTSRSEISKLLNDLSPSSSSESSSDNNTSFDELIGYYNVSYTLPSKPSENPVGGKWTRSQRLWKIQRTLQHVLPAKSDDTSSVAQVINAIYLDCLWGLLPIWIVLRGDAVPLDKIPKEEDDSKATKKKKKAPPSLLPGLSARTVRAYFDAPRFALGRFVFTFGPTSSVVLDTPYIDDKMRIGLGGTSGSKFVFSRIVETDTQGVDGWKWVLEQPSAITKKKASYGLLWTSLVSGFAYKTLRFGMGKLVASSVFLTSLALLGLVLISTGGIETNGENYTPGKQAEA